MNVSLACTTKQNWTENVHRIKFTRTQNVFRFDITVKYPVAMHVVHRLDELPDVILHHGLLQVVSSSPNLLIYIHIHELKHKSKASRRLVI